MIGLLFFLGCNLSFSFDVWLLLGFTDHRYKSRQSEAKKTRMSPVLVETAVI